MSKSYYSTIFEQPADDVWGVIRNFNNYPVWVDGAGESEIEAGKSGDLWALSAMFSTAVYADGKSCSPCRISIGRRPTILSASRRSIRGIYRRHCA